MFVCPECGASMPSPVACPSDGTPLAPIGDDLLLGTTIGAYRVARLLGIGGMGRVYKGVHPTIGSRVAIKVLSRECSDRRELVERFFAEAKAVNLIRHESIVNVLDLSVLPDGRPYIIMEYLDGAPLASILEEAQRRGEPLPLGGIARLAAEVLDALGAAHAKGIVHRDLKPDNIFVTPGGRAKVLDFGIAKLRPELGGSATHTGSLLGTPHYMSPEQAASRPVDHRADIYAMGVILFECATLHKPFIADSLFELLRMHVEATPPSPRAGRPDMPPELEQIIYTALAKQPEQRFASAQAMSAALQHATRALPQAQWAPITPGAGTGVTASGWAPAPPASWSGSQPPPSTVPGSTQTAGQVTRPTTSSRKGLWLALGAVVVVGGGVTAAVLAGGDDRGSASSAPQVAAGGGAPGAGTADPWQPGGAPAPEGSAGGAAPAATDVPPAAGSATPPSDEAGDGDDGPDDSADDGPDDDDLGQLDQVLAELPEGSRGSLPPSVREALAKYGSFAKMPAAVKLKIARDLAGNTGGIVSSAIDQALSGPGKASAAVPPPPDTPQEDTPQKDTPRKDALQPDGQSRSAALGADGWVHLTQLSPPGRFDPKHLDPAVYLPFAIREAKKMFPDARLFRIDAEGVFPDGHADLTLAGNGSLDFRFITPSRARRDPKLPRGVKQDQQCMFRIIVQADGVSAMPMSGWACKEKLLGPPRCSFAAVWKKALAKHAPRNAIATLGFRAASNGVARWYFDIDDPDSPVSEMFPDDC